MATIKDYHDLSKPNKVDRSAYSDLASPMQSAGVSDEARQRFADMVGANTTPFGNLRDALYGVGHAGENVAKSLYGSNLPAMPDIRQAHPNSTAESLGQYLPFAIAGGPSLLGSTVGAAIYGGTQYDPNQPGLIDQTLNKQGIGYTPGTAGNFRNAAEDAAIQAIFHGLIPQSKAIDTASLNFPGAEFKKTATFQPHDFKSDQLPIPEYLKQKPENLSPAITEDLATNIMGNRNLEQSGKELASDIHTTYKTIKEKHSNDFNKIFNSPTGEISFQTDEPILVKDQLMHDSQYRKNNFLSETKDKNLDLLNNRFMDTPSVENGHKLQSELGSEIGYLKKQYDNGLLDAEGKNRLKEYADAQNTINQDIRSELNNVHPDLMASYDQARDNWRKNVIPYHVDKDLREIAEGRMKNPEAGKIVGIFKNPEESINKVAGDLYPSSHDKITHIALGKVKEDLKPEELLNARKALDLNGMSSYIRPEHEQSFRNLRSNLQLEKQRQIKQEANEAFVKGLEKMYNKKQSERYSESKVRQNNLQKASAESDKIVQGYQKQFNKDYTDKLKAAAQKDQARSDYYKNLMVKGLAIAGAHELGLNNSDLLAGYLAGLPKRFIGSK